MEIVSQDDGVFILSLLVGDEILSELADFSRKQEVKGAVFAVIGAVSALELAWYDVSAKRYRIKEWREGMEIANMTGNISWLNDEVIVHAHGTFAGADFMAMAGHVNKAVIGAAGEIFVRTSSISLERSFDEQLGLNILKGKTDKSD